MGDLEAIILLLVFGFLLHNPKIFVPLSIQVLMIALCAFHSNDGELESLNKLMVDLVLRITFEKTKLYIKTHE